jgi:hypothetical protein
MKTFFYFLLCFVLTFQVKAQVVIPVTSIPDVGDTFVFNSDTRGRPEVQKQNGIFDFSSLVKDDSTKYVFTSNRNTTTYPLSNLNLTIDGDTANTLFLRRNSSDLSILGFGASAVALPLPVPINPVLSGRLKYLTYPLSISTNSITSDTIKAALPATFLTQFIDLDSIIAARVPDLSNVQVDSIGIKIAIVISLKGIAEGKIKTPIDTSLDVLKLERKTTIGLSFTLFGSAAHRTYGKVSLSNPLIALYLKEILFSSLIPADAFPTTREHFFISTKFRQPIVNVTLDTNGNYETIDYRSYTSKSATNSIQSVQYSNRDIEFYISNGRLVVLPNDQFGRTEVAIYDLSGRQIAFQVGDQKIIDFDISNIANGLYVLTSRSQKTNEISRVKIALH